jgi:SPP1 gp7 family putative phage head morphogenesis protein
MNNGEYWQKRFELLEQAAHQQGVQCYADIEKQYRQAQKQLEGQIAAWYQRFASNNGVTLAEAKRMLNAKELAELKWDVNQYIQYGQENAINGTWVKQLENASARFHISRLEALKLQTQQSIEVMFGNQLDSIDSTMRNVYKSGYYHTAYEIQKGVGVGWDFSALDDKQISKVINKPWAVDGKNFSERIWGNRQKLVNELNNTLTQNIILGKDPQKAIDEIARKMNTSKTNAGRLVMTEEAFFSSAAQKDCFDELDVEQFEIVATLDSHTSDICRGMDGKHFPMSEWKVGVTAPPFHVHCRSTTVPYFDDEFDAVGERAARDEETGKTYFVPGNMTYKEWEKAFVNGGDKSGLKEAKVEKEMTVEEIQKQVAENNIRIEALTSEYSQKHQALENALLFGNEDVDTLNKMSQEVQAIKADLNDMIAQTDVLKAKLPQESVQNVQAVVIEGKNMIGDVDYTNPDLSKFDHVIEKSIHAQGFDGNPSVVEYEDFKKAMEESGFYAERTYSANTQELLDEYREQLYNGKWYVDCSEGGAQYGQGMYCASCYDLANNEQMGGIGMEMSHYQQIGLGRGNGFYYTESITLQPDTKIFELPSGMKADEYIADAFRNAYMRKFASKEQLAQVEQYIELSEQISNLTFTESSEFIDNLYQKRADASIGLESLIKASLTAMEDATDGRTYHGLKNPGVLVTEMGYDAIKATGHGESGSYTVILNRTKVLFCKGGSIYGN